MDAINTRLGAKTVRRGIFFRILCGLILFPYVGAQAASKKPLSYEKTITVTSDSRVRVKPDLATISLHFSAYGWKVDSARKKTDRVIKKFLQKLAREEVTQIKVQLGETKLKPSYQFNRDIKTHVPSDFLVSRQVNIHLENLEQIGKVMDVSLSVGSFLLESARLTVKDKTALEERAFKRTLEKARKKAESIAKSLGTEVQEVINIQELKTETVELNLIQGTAFAMLAASNLKKEPSHKKDEREPEKDSAQPVQNGDGFFALPQGEEIAAFAEKSLPQTIFIHARSKLQITFLLKRGHEN